MPAFQFVFEDDDEMTQDVYIVEAVTWFEACEAIVGARAFEDIDKNGEISITQLTTNSVIRAVDN